MSLWESCENIIEVLVNNKNDAIALKKFNIASIIVIIILLLTKDVLFKPFSSKIIESAQVNKLL